jgi:glutamate carboxypeptidase
MPDLDRLNPDDLTALSRLEGRDPDMLERTTSWAKIASGSANVAGLNRLAPVLKRAFAETGAEVALIDTAEVTKIDARGHKVGFVSGPIVHAVMRPNAPIQVVLTGHYDTVFPEGVFETVTDLGDGRINGPGLADMKGGLVVMLEALKAFEAGNLRENLGYRVVISPDEETGNFSSAATIRAAATGAHIGMTYEPAMASGAMSGARKGSATFDIVFNGKAAHAGRNPDDGRNAVCAAAAFVIEIEKCNHTYDGVTFNVGKIDGGGAVNIVPELAIVRLGVRAPDERAAHWATELVKMFADQIAQRDGITSHVHGGFYRPPKPRNLAQDALNAAVFDTGKALGLSLEFIDTGGVCEGNNVFAAGTPNLDTLGVRGGNIHSTDEFVMADSFVERAALSVLLLNRLADGRIDAKAIKALMEVPNDV